VLEKGVEDRPGFIRFSGLKAHSHQLGIPQIFRF
jgi:hypothetical protein